MSVASSVVPTPGQPGSAPAPGPRSTSLGAGNSAHPDASHSAGRGVGQVPTAGAPGPTGGQSGTEHLKTNALGARSITFLVVAAAAPLTVTKL